MPISAAAVGRTVGPRSLLLTARRSMAFAAATGDRNPRYFDDTGSAPPPVPPLIAVSLEWPLVTDFRNGIEGASADELGRSVHASHDLTIHRLPRVGEQLTTTGTVVAAERRPAGTLVLCRLVTVDAHNEPVFTSFNGGVYRGVEFEGEPVHLDGPAPLPSVAEARPPVESAAASERATPGDLARGLELLIAPEASHIYTECADIWNPIHTERSVALAAGLPDIILHGTATLGYAAQAIIDRACGGDPRRLRRISCRFGAMVLLGTRVRLMVAPPSRCDGGMAIGFSVLTQDGAPAIRNGVAVIAGA